MAVHPALVHLSTLADVVAARRGQPIAMGASRKLLKGRKDRAEAKQRRIIRAQCVKRDGHCRLLRPVAGDEWIFPGPISPCSNVSTWAHLVKRSQTRKMAPTLRHRTQTSMMLCRTHHAEQEAGRLSITSLVPYRRGRLSVAVFASKLGADGPLRFT